MAPPDSLTCPLGQTSLFLPGFCPCCGTAALWQCRLLVPTPLGCSWAIYGDVESPALQVDVVDSLPRLGLPAGLRSVSSGVAVPFSCNPPVPLQSGCPAVVELVGIAQEGAGRGGWGEGLLQPLSPVWGKRCACRHVLRLLVEMCRPLTQSWATCPGMISPG